MKFLTIEDIVKMNVLQIKTFSADEPIGLKNLNALDMAVNQVNASAFGEEVYPSIYEKAAILMIQLIKKHPFHNANNRTTLMSALVFLRINGYSFVLPQQDEVDLVVYIATFSGDFDQLKDDVSEVIKLNTRNL
ncbi:type II toxin-antitoxin system death-on-curing family toxin [uncultured Enterococcus sp.]|uniref:type II toxin-antitoxin system death-on-curing family toxin n=1 Tax=uncultured Enterococcus sp. TaxID=167972 RepID=UPI00258D4E7B|nr:type II toxin-antitoxin system death-on-curing family toxin [uncultured Enterococcus sp.]